MPVPEAEPAVAAHRGALDESAARGVPAHVTVLFPFLPPDRIDVTTIDRLAAALDAVTAFDCTFARVGWFGEEVAWLDPEPREPFLALTDAVRRSFPGYEPYGGAYVTQVPHLTIGMATLGDVRTAVQEVAAQLPITAHIDRVLVMGGALGSGRWETLASLPLGEG